MTKNRRAKQAARERQTNEPYTLARRMTVVASDEVPLLERLLDALGKKGWPVCSVSEADAGAYDAGAYEALAEPVVLSVGGPSAPDQDTASQDDATRTAPVVSATFPYLDKDNPFSGTPWSFEREWEGASSSGEAGFRCRGGHYRDSSAGVTGRSEVEPE
jgi:hypothetical protein